MSKKIAIIWLAVLLGALALLIPGASMVKNVRHRDAKAFRSDEVKNWEVSYNSEPDEDGLYRISYKNTLTDIEKGGEVLMFYAYHGDVYAYADGDLLYSLVMDKETTYFPAVSGDTWNCFHVPAKYEGAEVEIIIETKYDAYLEYVPEFYLGDRLNIVRAEFQKSMVSLLLCIAIFVVGIVIMVYSWLTNRNHYDNYDIVYLGAFAVLLAFWFLINMPVFNMILDLATVCTYLSYLVQGTVSVPLILFEKRIMDKRYGRACDSLCVLAIGVQAVSVILQLAGIKDLKETLFCVHIVFVVSIVGLVTLLILNLKQTGFKNLTTMNRINILFGMLTAAGVAVDLAHFYLDPTDGKNYEFTKLAVLVYIIALCFYSIRETERLMKKGKDAQRYEELAYMDELTGVFNRMACNNDMRVLDLKENCYTVFMFDLNNLKKCNDSLGHNFGDDYIVPQRKVYSGSFRRCWKMLSHRRR